MYLHGRMAQSPVGGSELPRSIRRQSALVQRQLSHGGLIFIVVVSCVVAAFATVFAFCFVISRRKKAGYKQAASDDANTRPNMLSPGNGISSRSVNAFSSRNNSAVDRVDRNTSVRSVMTLPAYRQTAAQNERVIGREGERDGVDVIVDLPTEEEMEALRDEEMETMYRIRVARRERFSEQQQRRAEREEARQRGDSAALASVRERARAASNNTVVSELQQDLERTKEIRHRSISSVSYANVGLARHDGTRIRANSAESERMGLLSDAAPPPRHQRRSVGSELSMEGSSPLQVCSPNETRAGENIGLVEELVEEDVGETMRLPDYEDISLHDASHGQSTTPMYEPPPDYRGPYRSASQRSRHSLAEQPVSPISVGEQMVETTLRLTTQDVGEIPRLPSLNFDGLPEIIVEPSSAHPRDDGDEHRW